MVLPVLQVIPVFPVLQVFPVLPVIPGCYQSFTRLLPVITGCYLAVRKVVLAMAMPSSVLVILFWSVATIRSSTEPDWR